MKQFKVRNANMSLNTIQKADCVANTQNRAARIKAHIKSLNARQKQKQGKTKVFANDMIIGSGIMLVYHAVVKCVWKKL